MLYMNANISPTSEHNTTQLQAPRIWNKCKIETFGEAWGRIPPPNRGRPQKNHYSLFKWPLQIRILVQ